jgi:predicted Zn-dependent peptidase
MTLVNDPWQFEQMEVGGVPVFYKPWPAANGIVEIRLVVLAGARHDPIGKEGLAHFMEHLPFNGCANHPKFLDIQGLKDLLFFGNLNARTNMEQTVFNGRILNIDLPLAATFFRDFVGRPLFKELGREKGVVESEIWEKFSSSPGVALNQRIRKSLYGDHRLGRSDVLGWVETIQKLTAEDFKNFHRQHYHRGNLRLVLVGHLTKDLVGLTAELIVAGFENGQPLERPAVPESWPAPQEQKIAISRRSFFGTRGTKTSRITVNRVVPAIDRALTTILGDTVREILFRQIRGRFGDTYTPTVTFGRYAEVCELGTAISVPPDKLPVAREIILNAVQDLADGKDDCVQLFKAKKQNRLVNLKHNERTAVGIIDGTVEDLGFFGRIKTLAEMIRETELLSYEELAEFVSRELNSSTRLEISFQP